jgi:phytoene dehydrogenase-like protein
VSNGHIVIVGGGLAGLSTACYARVNGWETTILEHNEELGGVCTAWRRGDYTIDGCIHWLTGGPFMRIYEELGIIPPVEVRTLDVFALYRDVRDRSEVQISADADAMRSRFKGLAPEDSQEVDRLLDAALRLAELDPGIDQPPELASLGERIRSMWNLGSELPELIHFRKRNEDYLRDHFRSERLRRVLLRLLPEDGPALFLLFMLGYLCTGRLSRPVGSTARFRDALVRHHHELGGNARTEATVDEIVVEGGRARGVRLADGSIVKGDIVVSTSSGPETIFSLLGGRYGAEAMSQRLARWKLFQPIVLASFGVAAPLSEQPQLLVLDGVWPFDVGGHDNHSITVRIFNDEPSVAPLGHTVVQAMVGTDYEWWATRGDDYRFARDAAAKRILDLLVAEIPEMRGAVRMSDVATPLTFWRGARSWRGAFEGWLPTPDNFMRHVEKSLPGLEGFYMAGQWVEPGGGVPTALMSGRHLVQILCHESGREFVTPRMTAFA